jgi:hypothetical protein
LWSAPRQWRISRRSVGDKLRSCASSSSLGSALIGGLAVDIEMRTLEFSGEILVGRPCVNRCGVKRFMAEQACQFEQLAGIVSQITQREGVPQRVGLDRHALHASPPRDAGNGRLDRTHRHRTFAIAEE